MTWTVALVPPEAVPDMWPTVAGLLAPAIALSQGRADEQSVLEWLGDRRYLLWVAYAEDSVVRAAFVTREARYPRRAMLAIDYCGGTERVGWAREGTRVFRSFARDTGLDGVEMVGRTGWKRALKNYGWELLGVLLEVNAAEQHDGR